jgi:hypothetical protein
VLFDLFAACFTVCYESNLYAQALAMLFQDRIDRDVVAFLECRSLIEMNGIKWKTLNPRQASLGSEPILKFIT